MPLSIASDPVTIFEHAKLFDENGVGGDSFGHSVSMSGALAVVGARTAGATEGRGYVYRLSGGAWILETILVGTDAQGGDRLGTAAGISGETIVLGAPREDEAGAEAGAAYVFVKTGETWMQQAKLIGSATGQGDRFGSSVAIDGDTIVVGAPQASIARGVAYVFTRTAGVWTEQQEITALGLSVSDRYGSSISVDQDTAAIGAVRDDGPGVDSGSVFIFVRSGSAWSQQVRLTQSDLPGGDGFGASVSVDGDTLAVGVNGDLLDTNGSVRMFERSGMTWTRVAILRPDDVQSGDEFGAALALSGNLLVVGAREHDADDSQSGAAYVFSNAGGTWRQETMLIATDSQQGNGMGFSVALSEETVLAGAWLGDGAVTNTGAAYAYYLTRAFCFGVACPCGHDVPGTGCRNSTGQGARLDAPWVGSLSAGPLDLCATGMPPSNLALLFAADSILPMPLDVGDGRVCIGGLAFRYPPELAGPDGSLTVTDALSALPSALAVPGETRYFQVWSRDVFCGPLPIPCPSPCGGWSNLSNAVEVVVYP